MSKVIERINNWSDVLTENNITESQFQERVKGLQPDEIGYIKEKLIVAAYNEGKLPDWNDDTTKVYPIFKMSSSGGGFSFDGHGTWDPRVRLSVPASFFTAQMHSKTCMML